MVLKSVEDNFIVSECIFFHIQPLIVEKMFDTFGNIHDGPPFDRVY